MHAVAAGSDVKVTAMYADSDAVSVAKPADDPALRMYEEDGVKMFVPTPTGYYWGNYSWENSTKIGGDMILLEQSGYSEADLKKQLTFADNPALKAGQVHTWASAGMDYTQQAEYMLELADWIKGAKVVTK